MKLIQALQSIPLAVRAYLYRIGLAVLLLAVGYAWLTEEEAVLWLGILSGVLAMPVAVANTPRGPGQ